MSQKNLYVSGCKRSKTSCSKVCRVSPRLQPIKCNQNTSQWFPPSTKKSPRRRPQLPLLTPLLSFIAPTTSIVELFPLYQCPPRRHHVGTLGPALRAHDWQCPQLSGANSDRSPSLNPLAPRNKLTPPQRSTTSSSKHTASEAAASPFRLTVAGTATTAVAVGSMAWYYHLFGPTLYAMTPQEEGFVSLRNAQKTVLNMMLGSIQPNTLGNTRNLQRPSTTKRTLLSFSTHYKLY